MSDSGPDLRVEQWPIERLTPYAGNPRRNDDAVERMVAAFREFGFRIPIVAKSDGSVVDGHLRLKAAKRMGLATVPVALADEMTDAQVKAFRLLANRSATWATWDDDLLKLELGELAAEGYDMALTGFDEEEVADLTGPAETGVEVKKVDTGQAFDRFWITVEGPLLRQADALQVLQEAMARVPEVDVRLGTVRDDG